MARFFKYFVFLLLFCFSFKSIVLAQKSSIIPYPHKHHLGLLVGYGDQSLQDVNYSYQVVLFQVDYSFDILARRKWDFDITLKPQYNITRFKYNNNDKFKTHGFEFGLNVGLRFNRELFEDYLGGYLTISSGPQYVSGVPKRQSQGFAFSDNFTIGLRIKLTEDVF
jgi:hypothetical protein